MKKLLIVLGILIITIIVIVVMRKKDVYIPENFSIGEASVASVSAVFEESFPLGVRIEVSGELPDSCTEIGDIIQTRDSETGKFTVLMQTRRPLDAVCAQVMTPFEKSFNLEGVAGLPKGQYEVLVNGVSTTFTFDVDNFVSSIDSIK